MSRPLKVFLSHAHTDATAVRALYDRLIKDGVDAWLDKEKLIPGQDWEREIRKAVREADVVIVCLSKQFNQRGYRQKEVRIALDEADMMPEGEIFIIPARLEECESLESLHKWHWVDLFEDNGYEKLMSSLRLRAQSIEVEESKTKKKKSFVLPFPNSGRAGLEEREIKRGDVSFGGNVSGSTIIIGNNNTVTKDTNVSSSFEEKIIEIKNFIEFGQYQEARRECVSNLSKGSNPLVHLLAAIAYSLDKRKKLRKNDWQIIEKHISIAIQDNEIRSTALAVLGCVKYSPFELNGLSDSSKLNLKFIKRELAKGYPIDKEILNLIDPTPDELKNLGF